jgi:predicted AAA+ superfamily ATPase
MAASNHERVGQALEFLRSGLTPFVRRQMETCYGRDWEQEALRALGRDAEWQDRGDSLRLDVQALLLIMWNQWQEVFKRILGHFERSLVSELREVRNRWAHQEAFSGDDTYRGLDSAGRLLAAISAPEAREVDAMKREVLRIGYDDQARREARKAAIVATEGQPAAGLRPWREVVTPHPDVASGQYQQAEFVADLGQVHRGEGVSEYRDPREFYQRTFLTEGLRGLLKNALVRLAGKGGDPVVELQTNFGGGKTHSMLALYHLFSAAPVVELPGIDDLVVDGGIQRVSGVSRAVLVGTALSPAQPLRVLPDAKVNTLWGELAWQIGREEGFSMVAQADAQGVSPGSDALRTLFLRFGPCLILIDEWIAFVRQLNGKGDQPAGSFDANMTFAQALTEAARQVSNTLVVAAIPASDVEVGGDGGRYALQRIRNIFGRMELSWRPASAEEGFEIVRRRLFEPIGEPHKFAYRDAVVGAFARTYREQSQEFPSACREGDYERRLKAAYPIHPELFDQLYGAWSTLDRFQRTRGVLRLMAAVIHALWERNDGSLLIMPGTVPVDDQSVQDELTRYLEDNWHPVIEKDVDGPQSLPLGLDRESPNLGRYSACRRVARTIYMGSAPESTASNRGIDEKSVKLGCVQPGENPAIFGDALRRLTDQATHLYVDGSRYWFSTQPSMTRLARDRAEALDISTVWDELKKRLHGYGSRGDFAGVHAVPDDSSEVPDEMTARLVILGPEWPHHASKGAGTPALGQAASILNNRGTSPRLYRNMLVFLAPDRNRLSELEQAVRQYLAWKSIHADADGPLNLNPYQKKQAESKRDDADRTVDTRIGEAYTWLLVPVQPNPQEPVEWEEDRLQGSDPLAVRASKKLRGGNLITAYSATSLRIDLDRFLWRDVPHLSLKRLWEYLASYIYLPKLRDQDVLLEAVQDGIGQMTWSDAFAYAEAYDEVNQRYRGLRAGQRSSVVMDGRSVLVKPEVAQEQIRREAAIPLPGTELGPVAGSVPGVGAGGERGGVQGGVLSGGQEGGAAGGGSAAGQGPGSGFAKLPIPGLGAEPAHKVKRFFGSVSLNPFRLNRDVASIADEVVQHFTGLDGADVEISLDISVKVPTEIPEQVVRTVAENCRTLKFRSHEFERE